MLLFTYKLWEAIQINQVILFWNYSLEISHRIEGKKGKFLMKFGIKMYFQGQFNCYPEKNHLRDVDIIRLLEASLLISSDQFKLNMCWE